MTNVVVVGGQWGDEGKGKIVDLLCPAFANVVRFNGGNNAGHTVKFADRHFALHLIPSGILQPGCRCLVGPGVVIDPTALLEEIRMLEDQAVSVRPRLLVSPRAHLVLPGYRALDLAREAASGAAKLGTTGRGIGPAYEGRARRTGVRLGLARDPKRLRAAVAAASADLEQALARYPGAAVPPAEEIESAVEAAVALAPQLGDVSRALAEADAAGQPILFEGAQGTLLDLDHGTYPFVTSSGCLAGYAAPACGLPARAVGGVLGVFKAYTTRVGSGPFPTELSDGTGEHLRRRGTEFGTTTGRPRRTGWFDAVAARAAVRWSGIEAVALTKLDVLDELTEIRVATAYQLGGQTISEFPDDADEVGAASPLYETLPGWQANSSAVTASEKLPEPARRYVARLEELLDIPVVVISTGPRREETIVRRLQPLSDWNVGL
ncbi:MAG: adenylosuccinate synthase [Acidobacteria bacterium 21-70-11]|nr:MAG: adenylosuccinate synthase [Acidobacteria bacterium 21-70-11]